MSNPDVGRAAPGPAVGHLAANSAGYRSWGAVDETLRIGDHEPLVRSCASVYAPPPRYTNLLLLARQLYRGLGKFRKSAK